MVSTIGRGHGASGGRPCAEGPAPKATPDPVAAGRSPATAPRWYPTDTGAPEAGRPCAPATTGNTACPRQTPGPGYGTIATELLAERRFDTARSTRSSPRSHHDTPPQNQVQERLLIPAGCDTDDRAVS